MNNYILEYYQTISDGSVIVGEYIRDWYKRIVEGLESRSFFFDAKKANKSIKFVTSFCRHHEGALAPNLIVLELWQKAFLSVIFGILDGDGNRQFREVFLVIGRKNGKTLLAAAISAYMAYLDGEYGARIYFCAPKLDQSRLCFEAFYQMILKEAELSDRAKKRRTDIYIEESNSSAMPLAFSARKSDGLNPHLTVCDEIASWHGDAGLKQYEVLKSALGARRQPMILSISTAGYEEDGIFDELMKRSTSVIKGTSRETRLAPFIYMIDDVEKWNDINEIRKANPNLGVSVSVDYMLEEIAVAESSLSKKVEYLTKYCNVKQNSSLAWLGTGDIRKSFVWKNRSSDGLPFVSAMVETGKLSEANSMTLDDFRGCYCLGGIDLSQTTDLTACSIIIEKDSKLFYFVRFFLPQSKIDEATARDGIPYRIYIQKGWLKESGENFVDYHDCFDWFRMLVDEYEILPLQIGYDRYTAQYLVQDMEAYGFHMESVYQGTNLTGIINTTEGMLKDGDLISAEDNDLMKLHWLDAAMKLEAESGRKKLIKVKKNAHVDGVACLLDAMCMRANHWDEYREQLKN